MNRVKYLFELAVLLFIQTASAQRINENVRSTEPSSLRLQSWAEDMEELSMAWGEEYDWEDELEELSHHLQEPLNLNTATRRQLELFPFLTDIQIEHLLAYIYIHGAMQTIYELQAVEAMDKRTIEHLLPFVCVKPVEKQKGFPNLKQIVRYGQHQIMTRVDVPFYTRAGYKKDYLGPSLYHSFRYGFHYGDYVYIGLTGEKDAGEPMFALHNSKGYDFYSFYILIHELGPLKSLAIGNYRLNFGQGLVLGNSFGLGKSFSITTSDYRSTGIRKHSSTDEFHYFRGIAGTVGIGRRLNLSAFYSHRTLDGVERDGKLISIYKTGLHRSESEAVKSRQAVMQMTGGNLTYEKGAFKLGTTGIYYCFDSPYKPRLSTYAKYNLQGNHFYNLGVDYRFCVGKWMASGEWAKGKKGYASMNRLQYTFSPDYRILLLHRYYSHDYWAFFAHSWSEGSVPQNENGWYVAADLSPWKHWRLFGSFDFFSFPWWKYRVSKPSQGWEGRLQAAYSPLPHVSMYVNYRYKQKERDMADSKGKDIRTTHHHRIRYRLLYVPGKWRLQTTADYVQFHAEGNAESKGWQLTQSCGYQFSSFPLAVTLQGTWFHTDDYDARVYAYEKGLLNTFYTPSFYGKGFRCSAHVRYDINKQWMCLVKIGHTAYSDREEIGSGKDLIQSNRKTDLQMQVRVKF